MAWTRVRDGAVQLVDSSGTTWLGDTTSTGTVNLYEWSMVGDALRMFLLGLGPGYLNTKAAAALAGVDPDAPPIIFIDSLTDAGTQRFIVTANVNPGDPNPQVRSTVIPQEKPSQLWYFTLVYYGAVLPPAYAAFPVRHPDDGVWSVRDQQATFDVFYKDPSIVHLPGGQGWLMLLSRARKLSSEVAAAKAAGTPPDLGPEGCLSDIVAYRALEADPGFEDATTVTGPYWIGVNIRTLGAVSAGVRFWLSVPTGAMLSANTLAVYFVVEATRYAAGVQGDAEPIFDALRDLDRQSTSKFESCLGVHLIGLADLLGQPWGDEDVWAATASAGRYKVPRTVGVTYVWYDDGSGAPSTELVDFSEYVKLADPACARCSLDPSTIGTVEYLRFFTAVIPRGRDWLDLGNRDDQHGLWMATPIATGAYTVVRKDGSRGPTAAGVDWLLKGSRPFEPAVYDVASREDGALTPFAYPIDPDPVRLTTGEWRVDWGLQEDRNNIPVLMETQNDDVEVCASAVAALLGDEQPALRHPHLFHLFRLAGDEGGD